MGNFEKVFIEGIKRRIEENRDFSVAFTGKKGSGKSWSAIKFGEIIAGGLGNDFGIDNIVFRPGDFIKKIKEVESGKGAIIMFDEFQLGMSSRDWYKRLNKTLVHCVEIMRTKNIISIITCHDLMRIDKNVRNLIDYNFEMRGLGDYNGIKVALAKPFKIKHKAKKGDLHWNYHETRGGDDIRTVRFYKPSKELREKYEEFRGDLAKKVLENAEIEKREGEKEEEKELTPKEIAKELLQEEDKEDFIYDRTGKPTASKIRVFRPDLSRRKSQDVKNAMELLINKKEESKD